MTDSNIDYQDLNQKTKVELLKELAGVFLKLGTISFGGPAAHIAMMEEQFVRKRKWLSAEQFLDLLGATNLIPGPNSTEMAIHIGHLRAGWAGLIVSGFCFILPAATIVLFLAWLYVHFGKLVQATGLLYGVKPVIIAVVLQALLGLGRAAIKTRLLAFICVTSVILSFLGINELIVLFMAGLFMAVFEWIKSSQSKQVTLMSLISAIPSLLQTPLAITTASTVSTVSTVSTFSLWRLFLFFIKVGSVLFGSGYVLLAFLRADLVEKLGWLTQTQLLDAIAIGQVTPGPVFTTATFIGYVLGGFWGALIATIGIFLPAFIFVGISSLLIPKLRKSLFARGFLDGVNVASLALMAVVTWQLSKSAIVDVTTIILAIISGIMLIYFRINSMWLVAIGIIIGMIFK